MTTSTRRLVPLLLLLSPAPAAGREGLFLRFGLGPGVSVETSAIDGAGLALAAKDHAIGWGITESFAVQVTDFGALVREKVGEYDYLNLDAFGLGGTAFLANDVLVSASAGYGQVTFAHDWWEPTGEAKDEGVALNAAVRKEWSISRRWTLGAGAQASYFRTFEAGYTFFNLAFVGSVSFYLEPK